MNTLVCIDSNCLTFLVDIMYKVKRPTDTLAEEKIALLQSYLYQCETFLITPTVRTEYEKIKEDEKEYEKKKNHRSLDRVLLTDTKSIDYRKVENLAKKYMSFHRNQNDCQIVAEAELGQCDIFLTYDKKLLKKLSNKTSKINIMKPSEYWNKLNLPHGISPCLEPAHSNPLSRETWWLW